MRLYLGTGCFKIKCYCRIEIETSVTNVIQPRQGQIAGSRWSFLGEMLWCIESDAFDIFDSSHSSGLNDVQYHLQEVKLNQQTIQDETFCDAGNSLIEA